MKWKGEVESAQAHCSLLLHFDNFSLNRAFPSTFFYSFQPATTRRNFLIFPSKMTTRRQQPFFFFVVMRCVQGDTLVEKEGRVMNHKSHIIITRKPRCKQQRKQENTCCCTFVFNSRREKEGWGMRMAYSLVSEMTVRRTVRWPCDDCPLDSPRSPPFLSSSSVISLVSLFFSFARSFVRSIGPGYLLSLWPTVHSSSSPEDPFFFFSLQW